MDVISKDVNVSVSFFSEKGDKCAAVYKLEKCNGSNYDDMEFKLITYDGEIKKTADFNIICYNTY